MSVLTDQASAEVRRNVNRLYGTLVSLPAIMVSDGIHEVYAADVNIGATDPSGSIQQYLNQTKKGKSQSEKDMITGLPGQKPEDWQLDDSLPGNVDTTLHNVVIAKNNLDIIYADVGAPVICERDETGLWQIVGFSMERPGTHKLYAVDLGDLLPLTFFADDGYGGSGGGSGSIHGSGSVGPVIDLSIETHLLSLGQIGTVRPFGMLPFGASAVYQGGKLLRVG